MKYSVASNWDNNLSAALKKLNAESKKDKITELFSSLSPSVFGYAAPTPVISAAEVEEKIKKIKKAGFKFNYLINASVCPNLNSKDQLEKSIKHITWVKEQKVDIITVGNERVLSFIYKYFPELKVNISIVLRVKTILKVNLLRKKYTNIKRITLHQTLNRDHDKLIKHIANAHKSQRGMQPVQIELLANEICLFNCPLMKKHYNYLSRLSQLDNNSKWSGKIDKFDINCNEVRAKEIIQFLNSCWIRPEDVELYENLGVDILKIAGKTTSTSYLLNTAKSYMKRSHSGNIMNLFSSDWWPKKRKPYLNNSSLNGFLERLWLKKLNKISSFDDMDGKYNIKYK